MLSPAGKMVMLNSVLSAMPTHTMTCFKLPKSLCRRIQSALTRFWWDASPEKKKMCWVSWSKLAKSKKDGGLGFREIEDFNDALLAKQAWRILTQPQSLLARTLLGKYCKKTSFLDSKAPQSSSHGWRGIIIGKDLLLKGLDKIIGDGTDTSVWNDPWISLSTPMKPYGPPTFESLHMKVADLLDPISNTWNKALVRKTLPEYAEQIFDIKVSSKGAKDRYAWLLEEHGNYSSKTGYYVSIQAANQDTINSNLQQDCNWNKVIWQEKMSPKIKLFLWKATHAALPIGENLEWRSLTMGTSCLRCGERETTNHLFHHCSFAQAVWDYIPTTERIDFSQSQSFLEGAQAAKRWTCLPPSGIGEGPIHPWVCWSLWNARNKLLFEDKQLDALDVATRALREDREWQQAQAKTQKTPPPQRASYVAIPDEKKQNSIHCFTDGAWKSETRAAGIGIVFKTHQGQLLLEESTAVDNVPSPLVAEALAISETINAADRKGWKRIIIYSDSQILVRSLTGDQCKKEIYGIVYDIKKTASTFDSISFRNISRKDNIEADSIAKSALSSFVPV